MRSQNAPQSIKSWKSNNPSLGVTLTSYIELRSWSVNDSNQEEYITRPIVGVESIKTTNILHVKCFIILLMRCKGKEKTGVTYRSLLFYMSEWFTSFHPKPHSKPQSTVVIVLSIHIQWRYCSLNAWFQASPCKGRDRHTYPKREGAGTIYYYTKYGKPRYRLTKLDNMWHPYGKIFSKKYYFGVLNYPLSLSNKNRMIIYGHSYFLNT